jgi:hypothetical protein
MFPSSSQLFLSSLPIMTLYIGVLTLVPESPHFLIDRGREEEAWHVPDMC